MVTFGFLIVATTWYADVLASVGVAWMTLVLAGFAITTVLGRIAGGYLADVFGDRTTVAASLVGLALSLGAVTVALYADSTWMLLVALALTGAGFGLPFGPLFALAFANLSEDAGVTLVVMTIVGNAGALVYPWAVGQLLSTTSSYAPGFALMMGTVAVTVVIWVGVIGLGDHSRPATEHPTID